MKKLGKREYLIIIVKAITDVYGDTLWEGDTDIQMAQKVLKRLTPYLNIRSSDISDKEFKKWREEFIRKLSL